jgi:hypothetical protein
MACYSLFSLFNATWVQVRARLSSSRPSAAEMSTILRLGLILGAMATLLWCAFLAFLGKSIYVFVSTGD